jgi:hypothetical protein
VSATPLTASGSITARALNVGVTSAGKVYDGSTGATVASATTASAATC